MCRQQHMHKTPPLRNFAKERTITSWAIVNAISRGTLFANRRWQMS